MSNAYEDDPRSVEELIAEWNRRPAKCGPADMDRLSKVRGALFGKLRCPDSIRKPKNKPYGKS